MWFIGSVAGFNRPPFHSITTSNRASESVGKLHDLVNLELCQAYNVREGLFGEFLSLKM